MTRFLFIIFVLALAGCGSPSPITEVGNPTTPATSTGTTAAIEDSVTGFLPVVSSQSNGLSKDLPLDVDETVKKKDGFGCSFDRSTKKGTCRCPHGGNIIHTLDGSFSEVGGVLTVDKTFTTTFNNCVISACSENFKLDGTMTGSMSGTFNTADNSAMMTVQHQTAEACSGMMAGETPLGFNMTMTLQGTVQDFSGTLCIGGNLLTFGSLAELSTLTDPTSMCSSE